MKKEDILKHYLLEESPSDTFTELVSEPSVAYGATVVNELFLAEMAREGISFSFFNDLLINLPFTLTEWSAFLHISDRTMQRYKVNRKTFKQPYSEKIMEISLLNKLGSSVFGGKVRFVSWLSSTSMALGGRAPKEMLDTSFGLTMIRDEIQRIAHGVLA